MLYYFISFSIVYKDYNLINPQLLKLFDYRTFEFSIAINFKFSKQTMPADYFSLNKLCNLLANRIFYKFSFQLFREVIFSYYQIIITFAFEQFYNIYANIVKQRSSFCKKQGFFLLLLILILIYFIRIVILADIIVGTFLVIFAYQPCKSSLLARIASFVI